ncbi:MAG TPA: hypothetical protein VIL68_04175 [Propionibacteriaceae bacterium]|jgi:hypothetical protein
MADHPLVVEAKGWPQPPHLVRRSYIQRRSVMQLLFGFAVLGFATALLYGFSMRGDVAWIVFAVAFVGLAVVLIGANVRTLGRIHLIPEDRRVPITLPYAFAIDSDELVFPPFITTAEERWPLRETYARAGRVLDMVTLTCPGRRTRRFFAMAIRMPTMEAARIVNDHRKALV